MSTTDSSHTSTAVCKACGTDIDRFFSPGYCSPDCYYRYQGEKALRQITQDHRYCSTCFAKIKDILPPEETHPEHVIGWQFPTEHMTVAVDERQRTAGAVGGPLTDDGPYRERVAGADRVEHTRWACTCGAVDSRHRYGEIEAADARAVATNLALCLDRLARQDDIAGTFSIDRYAEVVGRHWRFTDTVGVAGRDHYDWAYVIGYALDT